MFTTLLSMAKNFFDLVFLERNQNKNCQNNNRLFQHQALLLILTTALGRE